MINKITPSCNAIENSPLEVSNTIPVVIVRVKYSILPPTIIIAPTSDNPLPRPANEFVSKGYLASQISVLITDKLDNLIDLK